MKCPFCECDLLLEKETFSSKDKDLLPKTRYLQAYVKCSKIMKLAEAKEYEDRLGNSGRIRDLVKDCLNDMEMALELKFGVRFPKGSPPNSSWDCLWMHELAEIRNHASHVMTAFAMAKTFGIDEDNDTRYYFNHIAVIEVASNGDAKIIPAWKTGKIVEGKKERGGATLTTEKQALPYLKETLEKIKEKLKITEI